MSKILLGITVDDKIYEEYASHKYVMANINRKHYDRIYESLCENMENLYAKPSL